MPLWKYLPKYFSMFGLFEPKEESVEVFYTDSEQCGSLRDALKKRTGKKDNLERFLKDCCAYRFWWNRESDADKLRKQLYKVLTFTHIGEKGSQYAGKDEIMKYIDTSLERLKTVLDSEDPNSPLLDDLNDSLSAWCIEARLVEFLGKINQDSETNKFNNEGAIQYKTQFSEQLASLLLGQDFYDEYLANWSTAAASNAAEGARAAGATKLSEGVSAVSAKTKENKDYIGFILSKLAEIIAEKEAAGDSAVGDLMMMGVEADVASLQDMYKKGYLKIPDFYFVGAPSEKTVLIQTILSFYKISDEQKKGLEENLQKFTTEKLKNKLKQLNDEKTVLIQSILAFYKISDEKKLELQINLQKFTAEQLKIKIQQLNERGRKTEPTGGRSRKLKRSQRKTRKN